MKNIRMLLVEDDIALLNRLKDLYREKFSELGFHATIEEAHRAESAQRLAKSAGGNPYDLTSLDVCLGDRNCTGLDVLSTLRRFRSTWMVALVTGVENDPKVDAVLGGEQGASLRRQLRYDAYKRFPSERLMVVEKPADLVREDSTPNALANRIGQIVAVYQEVSRLRYIFRPIRVVNMVRAKTTSKQRKARKFVESVSTHWQIRFNCGEIRTLPDKTGFLTLHKLLRLDSDKSLTPEAAMVIEPIREKKAPDPEAFTQDPLAEYFRANGVAWDSLDALARENLVRAVLATPFMEFKKLRELEDDNDLSPNEEDELARLIEKLGPLAEHAEELYCKSISDKVDSFSHPDPLTIAEMAEGKMRVHGGDYDKINPNNRGQDSPAASNFRARLKRVKDTLRHEGFVEFADHLDGYLQSTGANWSYNPPNNIEWNVQEI